MEILKSNNSIGCNGLMIGCLFFIGSVIPLFVVFIHKLMPIKKFRIFLIFSLLLSILSIISLFYYGGFYSERGFKDSEILACLEKDTQILHNQGDFWYPNYWPGKDLVCIPKTFEFCECGKFHNFPKLKAKFRITKEEDELREFLNQLGQDNLHENRKKIIEEIKDRVKNCSEKVMQHYPQSVMKIEIWGTPGRPSTPFRYPLPKTIIEFDEKTRKICDFGDQDLEWISLIAERE